MNIVLADVQSLNINLSESVAELDTEAIEFSNFLKSSIMDYPVDSSQVIENKELIYNSRDLQVNGEAETPLSWVAYLSTAEVTVTTDSEPVAITIVEPVTPVTGIEHGLNSSSRLIDSDESLAHSVVGEPLPADGKVLPPIGESMGRLPLTGPEHLLQRPETPVMPSTELSEELDTRKMQRPSLLRGEGRVFAQGTDQHTPVNLDKLAESIPGKGMEIQSGHHVQPDSALARQIFTTPAGILSSFQASNPLPTQGEPLTIARPDSPVEWSHGLGDRVSWMINQKLNSALIRLDPPSLGKLEIHIQLTDEATRITINTQSAQTRDMIDNSSLRLRDVLQEAGYQNVNVDVGQDKNQPGSGAQQSANVTPDTGDNADAQQELSEDMGSESGRFISSDSLIDYFA